MAPINRLQKLRMPDAQRDLLDAVRAVNDKLREENDASILEAAKAIHDKLTKDFEEKTKTMETDIALRSAKSLTALADERIAQRSTITETAFADVRTDVAGQLVMMKNRMDAFEAQLQAILVAHHAGIEQLKSILQSLPVPNVTVTPTPVENRIEVNPTPIENRIDVAPTPVQIDNHVTNAVSPTPITVTNEVAPTPLNIVNNLELPERQKHIEYDDLGRPTDITERNVSGQ